MKKAVISALLAALMLISLIPLAASAETVGTPGVDMPSFDALDSAVIGRTTLYGLAINGGKFTHDFNYGGTWDVTSASGYEIVYDLTDTATQKGPFAAAGATATQACPMAVTSLKEFGKDGKVGPVNINNETGKADSKYVAAWGVNFDGFTEIKSFCFSTSAAGTFYESFLNGFDLYIGDDAFNKPTVETDAVTGESKVVGEANPTYKLVYHADYLAETGLWQLAADKSFSYFEADLDQPMTGSYMVIAISEDNLKTTKNFTQPASDGGTTVYPVFVIAELAAFDRKLGEAGSTEPVTETPTTEAPVTDTPTTEEPKTDAPVNTDAPGTEGEKTDAPVITAAPGTDKKEEKKGCGGNIAMISVTALILGTALIKKKKH